ncbi:MAG TPA: thioredoxin-like domain-containing protein [Gammaproteobacteria bacterium]|nr:thioredoxin-like domain-containing protein [Gammaproteobacteria bacterium]
MSEPRIRAPEFPLGLEWFNTDGPVKLSGQRGRVVLLDFWTYSCINCQHVLADLRYLEDKYRDRIAVIGIHSPKFPNEQVASQVRKAINRHHVRHPVVNDPKLILWRQYGIKAWPSIVVIDADGYVLGVLRGEGRRRQLDALVADRLARTDDAGPAQAPGARPRPEPPSTLSFPGKVLATPNRLFVSDSGRNRVLECNHHGRVLRVYGSGAAGLVDGAQEYASFNNPQGLALVDEFLFVADTGNHAVRRIRLRSGDVETAAGTGEQGRGAGTLSDDPLKGHLNSPWDLAYDNGVLYIAMAGSHQIWQLSLSQNTLAVYAGSGREGIVDGRVGQAEFAQPSGLAVGDGRMYVADSETSAVRAVRLDFGTVSTLVGAGLFEFGDADGAGKLARLQHPLGVAADTVRGRLWITDTFNNKIKTMHMKSNSISTYNIDHPLNEPGGLSVLGEALFVASTNAHEVLRVDLRTGAGAPIEIVIPDV